LKTRPERISFWHLLRTEREKAIEEIQLPWQIMLLKRPITTLARMSWNGAMKKVGLNARITAYPPLCET